MKHPFYWLHGGLAVLGAAVSVVLLNADTGHPPGIVFLPLAVIAWVVTHVFLGLVQWLSIRGRRRRFRDDEDRAPWPFLLVVVALICSLFVLYVLAGLGSWILSGEGWSGHRTVYLAAQLLALTCLVGILLRRHWGRLAAAAGCLVLMGYLLVRAVPDILSANTVGIGSLVYLALLLGGLGVIAHRLLRAPHIRAFFIDE